MDDLQVKFWGTRGSMPAPFENRMEYGGNTSCVSVGYDGGLVVFDAGTGIVALGHQLEKECQMGTWRLEDPVHIFIGHLHLDHIQGLTLFSWLFHKGAEVHLYGMRNGEISFRQRIGAVFGPPYWPVSIEQVPASVVWHENQPGETVELPGGARVDTLRADHPNGGQLFRMEYRGQSVVYGMDCELGTGPKAGNPENSMWEQYRTFARDCGLLIFDAPYTEETYPRFQGYGHSFWQQGLWMAKECGAKKLCICHHDWGQTDQELAVRERMLKEQAAGMGFCVEFAREEE